MNTRIRTTVLLVVVVIATIIGVVLLGGMVSYASMGCDPTTHYTTPVGCMPLSNLDRPNGLTPVVPRDGTELGTVWGALQVWGDELGYGSPMNLYVEGGNSYHYDDMSIYFGPEVLALYAGPGGLWYVLGHEYGHYYQQVTEQAAPDTTETEVHADYVSGVFLRWALDQGLVTQADVDSIRANYVSVSDTATNHGTGQQRTDAFNAGFEGTIESGDNLLP